MEKIIVDEVIPRGKDFKVLKLEDNFLNTVVYPIIDIIDRTIKKNKKWK
jgi:hypothetical protein